jgi:hypothetical protein
MKGIALPPRHPNHTTAARKMHQRHEGGMLDVSIVVVAFLLTGGVSLGNLSQLLERQDQHYLNPI